MAKKLDLDLQLKLAAKAFYISGEEKILLKKIKGDDKTALVQLTMLNMPYIISCAQGEQDRGLPLTNLIDAATHGFIIAAEKAAQTESKTISEDEGPLDGMWKQMHIAIEDALEKVPATNQRRVKYDTPKRIVYLNRLNRLLKEKEKQIVAIATEYLSQIKRKIESKDSFTTDYNLVAEVQYCLKNGSGPAHVYWAPVRYEGDEKERFGLLCSDEDWREPYMPILDEPYCYLLHDLIDHSRLGSNLFKISSIWIDIQLCDQQCIEL